MDNIDGEYEKISSRIQEFRLVLERLIQALLEVEGIQIHSVTSRIKSKNSVLRKLQRPGRVGGIDDLTDMLGVRIITYFQDDVDTVARLIEREFTIDRDNSVDKRALMDPDRFGYLSIHYVARLNLDRIALPEYRSYDNIRFEIQVRSILQHAWAEIEHDLGYKSESSVPREVRRRFSQLAGLLELADKEFLEIRKNLTVRLNPRHLDLQSLLARPGLLSLPAWEKGWREPEYLAYVSRVDPRFLLMDRILIEIPSSQGRFEPCDLLGPNNELVHVKRPNGSSSFGHLFNQVLVSTEILLDFSDARTAFADAVKNRGAGRVLPPGFRPKDVIIAFPSGNNPTISMDRIPSFSRVTLSRVAEVLDDRGVALRIVGIVG